MKIVTNIVLPLVLLLLLVLSCAGSKVYTTRDNLMFGASFSPIPHEEVSAEIQSVFPGEEVILADRDSLKNNATYIPVGGGSVGSDWNLDAIVSTAFSLGKVFIPSLAAYEGVLTLFSQRKRKNWATAVKAMVPNKKGISFSTAIKSAVAATGARHSTESSAAVANEEWKRSKESTGA